MSNDIDIQSAVRPPVTEDDRTNILLQVFHQKNIDEHFVVVDIEKWPNHYCIWVVYEDGAVRDYTNGELQPENLGTVTHAPDREMPFPALRVYNQHIAKMNTPPEKHGTEGDTVWITKPEDRPSIHGLRFIPDLSPVQGEEYFMSLQEYNSEIEVHEASDGEYVGSFGDSFEFDVVNMGERSTGYTSR